MRIGACVAAIAVLAATVAVAQTFKVGDRVEAYNSGGYYPATIVEEGSGSMAGYYKVKYDGYAQEQYIKASNLRAPKGPATATAAAPRLGKYACQTYGAGGRPNFMFYLVLGKGTYSQTTPNLAGGAYAYNAAAKTLTFKSGPYQANNWIGLFSVEREGKTHKIVLRDAAKQAQGPRVGEFSNIYCTNSTDS